MSGLQHRYATECPSRFVCVRGEATPGWRVDTSGRAERGDSAWNGSGAVARRLGAQAVARGQRSHPLRHGQSSISRRPSGNRTPGQSTGGPGAWSPRGGWEPSCWHWAPSCRRRRDAEIVDVGLVCCAVPTSQVELVWKPVQARHRLLHLSPPMCEEATVRWSPGCSCGGWTRWPRTPAVLGC
jgi:hypothetical protein